MGVDIFCMLLLLHHVHISCFMHCMILVFVLYDMCAHLVARLLVLQLDFMSNEPSLLYLCLFLIF
jgi:hypothetical protein